MPMRGLLFPAGVERGLIVTIDGPAGAGKSTVARALAQRIGFDYLDSGSLYRAATWKAMRDGVDLADPEAAARAAREARIEFRQCGAQRRVLCDGNDVTEQIRTPEVTENVRYVADQPAARSALIELQRQYARGRDLVTEGRDQGTEAFPGADVRFYLDATLEVRADRRLADRRAQGIEADPDRLRAEIQARDRRDTSRPVGRLRCAEGMVRIDSTGLTVEQVVLRMAQVVACRRCEAEGEE